METLDHLFHLIVGTMVLAAGWQARMAAPIASPAADNIKHETREFVRIFEFCFRRS